MDRNGEGHAIVQFRSNAKSIEIWNDVKAGIIRNVSGYAVHEMTEQRSDERYSTFRAVDWEPFEISMVPILSLTLIHKQDHIRKIKTLPPL